MGAVNNSETFSTVSLSGGKDSSALLLLMIEKGLPIDCVLYADTGMEFPEMEAHIAKLDDFLYQERGIHITTLRHPHGFEWMMFEEPKQKVSCLERHIGIAADEAHRCKSDEHNRYPLVEWGITEAQALQICYNRGCDWDGLYEIYHRASCWCCPLQRIDELRKLRRHHPELWARLLDMDNRARAMFGPGPLGQFKQNWSVARLEERFAREDAEDTV